MTLTMQDVLDDMSGQGYTDITDMMVKQTWRVVSGMRRWSWLEASQTLSLTVANQGVASINGLANNNERVKLDSVRLIQGTSSWGDGDFDYMDRVPLRNLRVTDTQSGRPRFWTRMSGWDGSSSLTADQIMVWPIPDGTYSAQIDYYATSDSLSSIPDAIQWPEQHVNVIEEHLLMKVARQQRDWAAYDRAKANFKEAYLDAVADDNHQNRQTSDEIQEWRGWRDLS
jgi:hypothetical protein